MKSQTRHKDILPRQSEITPLSTGDSEQVLCLGLNISIYKFITQNGNKMTISRFLGFLPLLEAIRNPLKKEMRHFPMHI